MKDEYLANDDFRRVKTFMFSMNLFELNLKQRQAFLSDKRLTKIEKDILECSILLKDCRYEEIVYRLSNLIATNELVESQRKLILGMTYSLKGDCLAALPYLEDAKEKFKRHDLRGYTFYSLLQIFFAHLNLKNASFLKTTISELTKEKGESIKDEISYLRCLFNYHSFFGDFKKAELVMDKLDGLKNEMHSSQVIGHLVDKFDFFLKINNLTKCEYLLEEMKNNRKHNLSANFKFMRALLNHVAHKKPIYLYDKDFKDTPLLLYQLKVIQNLEEGHQEEALSYWNKLSELNSDIYADFMNYKGDKCLFSICLEMYREQACEEDIKTDPFSSKEEALLKLLQDAKGPLKKEKLHFLLWGEEITSKNDLVKLAVLVTRIRKKNGIDIISRKGCFFIPQATNKAS